MRNIFFLICICCVTFVKAQSYDTTEANVFINQILKEKYKDTTKFKIYLVEDLYNTIYPSESRKQEINNELKKYLTSDEIEKQLENCAILSHSFKWIDKEIVFNVISNKEASNIIQKANRVIIDSRDSSIQKSNSENKPKNIIVNTSPPLFITKSQCLIFLSSITGNTSGSFCLYMYKKQSDGTWREDKVLICFYS